LPHQDHLNIAVFIDFDNIEIGVRNTLGQQFDVGSILEAIKERGEVVTKIAYADWTRAGEYSRALTQHAIRLVQRNLTPGGDKNGADINLALDALEMAFTHPHINAYVIVGGDSDFLSLVEKLKQYDKKIFVVGGRGFTSTILQRNCHEFIAYENLAGVRRPATRGGRPVAPPASPPFVQAFPLVRRALEILADREVSPQAGLLKSTLLQLDSTFSERNYGASSFFDFLEKLSRAGFVNLRHSGRSLIVELKEGLSSEALASTAPAAIDATPAPSDVVQTSEPASDQPPLEPVRGQAAGPARDAAPADVPATESAATGVQRVGRILGAATNARWPMYLRNVRQILRQAEGGFDERRYGFGGLIDLLKACQRDGLVRVERDHRGGLRVFQGQALRSVLGQSRGSALPQGEPMEILGAMAAETPPADSIATDDLLETQQPMAEPIPIDTTAELLGRVQHRKPRVQPLRQAAAPAPLASTRSAPGKSAAKKRAAPRKSARSKKATGSRTDS
jgi:uncharacterized LabA/DUF88 family protein